MIFLYIISMLITIYFAFKMAQSVICRPPNKFVTVFAPPGTGKTTLIANIVRSSLREDKEVYCNVPIRGAKRFDINDLGKVDYRNCTIIIDEGGSKISNRNWHNNLSLEGMEFLQKHRHYNVDVYTFSQAYGNIDNKFRELTTCLIMLKKSRIPFYVRAIAIVKVVDLINGQIVEYLEYDRANSFRFFIANCWAYFDSYDKMNGLKLKLVSRYNQADL